jgi:hypothetical protein
MFWNTEDTRDLRDEEKKKKFKKAASEVKTKPLKWGFFIEN